MAKQKTTFLIYTNPQLALDTKSPIFMPTTFMPLFSHLQEHTSPTILMDARQWALALLLFLLSGPYVLDSLHTLNKFMIFIVIMPYFQLLLHHKPIGNIMQRKRVIFHCLITHLLRFKVIWLIVQLLGVCFNCYNTHFLFFKTIRNKKKYYRVNTHYIVAHFLCLKMIRDISQCVWFPAHCLMAHFLRLILIRDIILPQ